jgi:hypothetical protein
MYERNLKYCNSVQRFSLDKCAIMKISCNTRRVENIKCKTDQTIKVDNFNEKL